MTYEELLNCESPVVIYDGDCPFCNTYIKYMRFKSTIGAIRLVDARSTPSLVAEFKEKGFNLNDGMAFIFNGQVYYGDDAVSKMSLLSTSVNWFNKLNYFVFSKPLLAKNIYPLLVIGRKILLMVLGRKAL